MKTRSEVGVNLLAPLGFHVSFYQAAPCKRSFSRVIRWRFAMVLVASVSITTKHSGVMVLLLVARVSIFCSLPSFLLIS
jgi:hypothetical protein